ncbi:hypothetical protein MRB53_041177 [Persea americana]|nr:hypothetical protein MRB53_041177 [Persea americana]
MWLPRSQVAQLYDLYKSNVGPASPPILILTSLNVDPICATRQLASLLKTDYIPHKIQPVSGYADLRKVGKELIQPLTRQNGGDGGLVICLGVGGLVDLEEVLGLDGSSEDSDEMADMRDHGVEIWIIDSRRPWNLNNVFGTGSGLALEPGQESKRAFGIDQGRILPNYRSGHGGIIVFDDGSIDSELEAECSAFAALVDMPHLTEQDVEAGESDDEDAGEIRSPKRTAGDAEFSEDEDDMRPHQRRRSNSSTPIPESPRAIQSGQHMRSTPPTSSQQDPSDTTMPSSPPRQPTERDRRLELLQLRRKHEATLNAYYNLGSFTDEPISSMAYSLVSELGREDNDLLWLAIVGVCSVELSPFAHAKQSRDASGKKLPDKVEQVREILRDEVRRLNPIPESEISRNRDLADAMPTRARTPTDFSIRLSPEPRFMLIRHWSLYDSMMHSTYLSTRLHIWSDSGKQRLHKLLAKMGVSLQEAGKSFLHMNLDIKQSLRKRLLKFAPQYNLDGLVPGEDGRRGLEGWGFVRSWGWRATLSALDAATIAGSILETGLDSHVISGSKADAAPAARVSYNARNLPTPPHSDAEIESTSSDGPDWTTHRFFAAYDALSPTSNSSSQGPSLLMQSIPTAQRLARAILASGSALMAKKQIRHLKSYRLAVLKEGPNMPLFVHPGALVKLAAWIAEALQVMDAEQGRKRNRNSEALVLGCLDESRDVYVVVGLGGAGAQKKVRSKAEIRRREEAKKRKAEERIAKKAERSRKRKERKRLQRERDEANGLLQSDDESDASDDTESEDSAASSDDSDESDEEVIEARKQRGYGLNRFGQAFQDVIERTGARVRIDSFEHSVVEVKKEDLSGFLEALTSEAVVG